MMAKDILLLRDLDVDMAGIGPFIPNPDTPLGEVPGGTVEMTLKMIALARIVTKDTHIPATTALSTIDALGREKAWRAGANVVMPNLTPIRYREHYRIYPNKACLFDETRHCWTCLHRRIASVGRRVSTDYGHSQRSSGMKPASSSGEQESSTLGYQRSNPIGGSLATQYGGPEQHG
jgi:biotin synthase